LKTKTFISQKSLDTPLFWLIRFAQKVLTDFKAPLELFSLEEEAALLPGSLFVFVSHSVARITSASTGRVIVLSCAWSHANERNCRSFSAYLLLNKFCCISFVERVLLQRFLQMRWRYSETGRVSCSAMDVVRLWNQDKPIAASAANSFWLRS
jgi:hypothetical protein